MLSRSIAMIASSSMMSTRPETACHFLTGEAHELLGFAVFDLHDLGDLVEGEVLDGVQQRLAAVGGKFRKPRLRLGESTGAFVDDRRTGGDPDAVEDVEEADLGGTRLCRGAAIGENGLQRCGGIIAH